MKNESSMSYKYGARGILRKGKGERNRCKDGEQGNYVKMLKNLREEHARLKQRVFKIQDPKYIIGLKKDIRETKKLIKE